MPSEPYNCDIDGDNEQKDKLSNKFELFFNVGDMLSIINDINQSHTEATIVDFIQEYVIATNSVTQLETKILFHSFMKDSTNQVCTINDKVLHNGEIKHVYVKRNPKCSQELIEDCIRKQRMLAINTRNVEACHILMESTFLKK